MSDAKREAEVIFFAAGAAQRLPVLDYLRAAVAAALEAKNRWIADLQSGLYVNCVYCGHRYGPRETTPATLQETVPSMADVLTAHVERRPRHPLAASRARVEQLTLALDELLSALADARRRHGAGDLRAIESNMLGATERQARAALGP